MAESFIATGEGWLTPVERVQLSVLLGLVSVNEIAEAVGLSMDEVVTRFELGPYLP